MMAKTPFWAFFYVLLDPGSIQTYYKHMVSVHALLDKQQTGNEMARLVRKYSRDLRHFRTTDNKPLLDLSLQEFYEAVRDIPYQVDRRGIEIITRPWHALTSNWPGLDCKKKSVIIASYLQEKNIPWRFVAVSSRPDGEIHHVLVEAKINGQWIEADATYPHNELGEIRTWSNRELLSGSRGAWSHNPVLVSMYGEGQPAPESDLQFDQVRGRLRSIELGTEPASAAASVVGIILAIVAACTGIAAIIVGAVQANRQEERAYAFQAQQVIDAREFADAQQTAALVALEDKRQKDEKLLVNVILPASLGAGALLWYSSRKKVA
jgi:hypothetical protein